MKLDIQKFADGTITIQTEVDNKGLKKGLDDIKSKANSLSQGFGSAAKSIGAAFLKGTAIASAAIAGMVAKGVGEYAKLEQSIGGVETLFKDSADTVIKNAESAYKRAGVDANAYMEQVTSFSASLLQATGGDTVKAAKTADMAIVDMADNANKMGTSIEMIQNAYQGFAKQNYMMLDNLKLGYGGTKTEMERLLADAEKITGIHYDISNLDDVYQAIHVIQGELGITGTTAEEAASTIQGSAASMKAAFTNFLSGAGGVEEVITTVETFGNNVMNAIIKLSPKLIEGIVKLADAIVDKLPELIERMLPPILNGAVKLVSGIVKIIPKLASTIAKMLPKMIPQLIQGLVTVIQELAKQMPVIIPQLVNAIIDGILSILDNINLIINAGVELLMGLIQGVVTAIPILIAKMPLIIMGIINGLIGALPQLITMAPQIIIAIITGLIEAIPMLIDMAPEIITGIITGLVKGFQNLIQTGKDILSRLWDGISNAIPNLLAKIPQIPSKVMKGIKDGLKKIKDVGKDLIKGLWNGIKEKWNEIKGKVEDFGEGIVKKFKDVFGIKSPSRVMRDEIGKYLAEGIGVGFEEGIDSVYRDMQHAINLEQAKLQANVETGSVFNTLNNSTPIQINVNADVEMDSTKVGRLITPVVSDTLKTGGLR